MYHVYDTTREKLNKRLNRILMWFLIIEAGIFATVLAFAFLVGGDVNWTITLLIIGVLVGMTCWLVPRFSRGLGNRFMEQNPMLTLTEQGLEVMGGNSLRWEDVEDVSIEQQRIWNVLKIKPSKGDVIEVPDIMDTDVVEIELIMRARIERSE